MKHTTPHTLTLNSILTAIGGGLLSVSLISCSTTPAASTEEATPTSPSAQATTPTQSAETTEATQATETEEAEQTAEAAETAEEPTATVQTVFPGLEAPEGEPELESITNASPAVGEVLHAAGPFDQRLVLQDLAFDGSVVSGEVLVTSDISELLALQVLAGFYDEEGNLLGTDRFDHDPGSEHTHGGPVEPEAFEIAVPAEFAGQAVSAAVGIPVLVNE